MKINESLNISVNWKAISGNHTITVIVDPENRIPEVNESNNIDYGNIYVASRLNINSSDNNSSNDKPKVVYTSYGDNIKYEYLSNGLVRATISFPTVYNEEEDTWEPADFNLYWNSEAYEWQLKKSRVGVSFKDNLESNRLYRFEFDGSWVEYSLNNGKITWENNKRGTSDIISTVSPPVTNVKGDEITYQNIFDYTSIRYKVLPFGVKEYIILDSSPKYNGVDVDDVFLLYTGELTLSNDLTIWADGRNYTNKDFETSSKIEFRRAGEDNTLFWFTPPIAYDSNPEEENWTPCFYEMRRVDDKILDLLRNCKTGTIFLF